VEKPCNGSGSPTPYGILSRKGGTAERIKRVNSCGKKGGNTAKESGNQGKLRRKEDGRGLRGNKGVKKN